MDENLRSQIFTLLLLFSLAFPLFSWAHIAIIAHRGDSEDAPENTIAAFLQAIRLNVEGIELDVLLTKENIPVVVHDPILKRTTNNPEPLIVEETPLQIIQTLDAGSWFDPKFANEKIPTLEEVLKLPFQSTELMIEIKEATKDPKLVATKVLETIQTCQTEGSCPNLVIGSMSHEIIHWIRTLSPEQQTVSIIEESHAFKQQQFPEIWAIHFSFATEEQINSLKETGARIWVWTVDDPQMMKALASMGVDGLITNRPKLARETLSKK